MKFSGIGGQAVMEGVMMRNGNDYAIAVRLSDGSIHVDKKKTKGQEGIWYKIPIIRGICSFVSSLVIGMSTLMDSASYFEEEEPTVLTEEEKKKKEKQDKAEMTGTLFVFHCSGAGHFSFDSILFFPFCGKICRFDNADGFDRGHIPHTDLCGLCEGDLLHGRHQAGLYVSWGGTQVHQLY